MTASNEATPNADLEAARKDFEAEFPEEDVAALLEPDLGAIAEIEAEIGLVEVDLDEAALEAIAADDPDDQASTYTTETISDLPQDLTESYGTGLQGHPNDRAGQYSDTEHDLQTQANVVLTGGDVDANLEDAETTGEEAVGGTTPTPDQDVVEELAAAVGIEMNDRSFLRTHDMLEQRDDQRWELDPMSAEDYPDRDE